MYLCGGIGLNALVNLPLTNQGDVIGRRVLNTIVCVITSTLTTFAQEYIFATIKYNLNKANNSSNKFKNASINDSKKKQSFHQRMAVMQLNTLQSSLVAISSGCSTVDAGGAVVIGFLSSVINLFIVRFLSLTNFKSISSVFVVHVISPVVGIISVGFLASKEGYTASYAGGYDIPSTSLSERADSCAGVFYGGSGGLLVANLSYLFAVVAWTSCVMTILFVVGLKFFDCTKESELESLSDYQEVANENDNGNIDYASILAKKLDEFEFDPSYPVNSSAKQLELDFFHDIIDGKNADGANTRSSQASKIEERTDDWEVCFVFPIFSNAVAEHEANAIVAQKSKAFDNTTYRTKEHKDVNTPAEVRNH